MCQVLHLVRSGHHCSISYKNPWWRLIKPILKIKYKDGKVFAKLNCRESETQTQVCLSAESYIFYVCPKGRFFKNLLIIIWSSPRIIIWHRWSFSYYKQLFYCVFQISLLWMIIMTCLLHTSILLRVNPEFFLLIPMAILEDKCHHFPNLADQKI